MSVLALGCALAAVDQLDGPWALVELPDSQLVVVPRRSLPLRTAEGDTVCVTPRRGRAAAPPRFTRARGAQPGEQDD